MKLRGRVPALAWSRGRTMPFRAHGDTPEPQDTLQRSLDDLAVDILSVSDLEDGDLMPQVIY